MVHLNLVQFIYACGMGIVLACCMEVTGHVYGAILAHMAANLIAVLRTECGSVDDGTMSHRYIILQNARHCTGLMDAGTILYIHSVSTSDGIHVRAQYRTIPDATVITKNTVTGQYGVLSDKTIL